MGLGDGGIGGSGGVGNDGGAGPGGVGGGPSGTGPDGGATPADGGRTGFGGDPAVGDVDSMSFDDSLGDLSMGDLIGRAEGMLGSTTSQEIGNKVMGALLGVGMSSIVGPVGMQIGMAIGDRLGLGSHLGPSTQSQTGNMGNGSQLLGPANSVSPSVQQPAQGYSINGIPIPGNGYNPADPLNLEGLAINGQPISSISG